MTRLTRVLASVAVGAFAALVPVAAVQATTPPSFTPAATLTGKATCVDGGWSAAFTFTNPHPDHTAVIVDVAGVLDPAVPIRVAPGTSITKTTPALTGPRVFLAVGYRYESNRPVSPGQPPVPPPVNPGNPVPPVAVPPGQPPVPGTAVPKGNPAPVTTTLTRTKLRWVKAVVSRCWCPKPTATPTTSPTASPSPTVTVPPVVVTPTTRPTVTPTATEPEPEPTTTTTPPPVIGAAPSLPLTGAPVAFAVGGGALLVAVGVAVVALVRRRRTSFSA